MLNFGVASCKNAAAMILTVCAVCMMTSVPVSSFALTDYTFVSSPRCGKLGDKCYMKRPCCSNEHTCSSPAAGTLGTCTVKGSTGAPRPPPAKVHQKACPTWPETCPNGSRSPNPNEGDLGNYTTPLWPDNHIPYQMSNRLAPWQQTNIKVAMKEIVDRTAGCVTFAPKEASDKDYVFFELSKRCYAPTGGADGEQQVDFTADCLNRQGYILRALMQTLGFYFETRRTDRTCYVDIDWTNVIAHPSFRDLLDTNPVDIYKLPYDPESVLHINGEEVAKNKNKWVIRNIWTGKDLNKPNGKLSEIDVCKIRRRYLCDAY